MSSSHQGEENTPSDFELPTADTTPLQAETESLKIPARADARELPTIGPFRTLNILGRGAMGVVYLADQTSPIRRRVALKVLRVGRDSKGVIARFERERQALALMDHPNIARVFDAGECEDGRPYFAMEYVRGLPITKYCDQHNMPNRRRLELFANLCDAIEHAHQRGLIHRDIKPSNILVGELADRAVVKVIDFGIAKSIGAGLYDDSFHTQTGEFVGTPAYMSPEQAGYDQLEIDTRTDVYSLGTVLYELLVGVLPFDFKGLIDKTLVQVQRLIVEREPMTPSTRLSRLGDEAVTIAAHRQTDLTHLQREIRGDLDWILMKALEKDRSRRYRSAFDLAADVRHHLAFEPISAGRPTLRYRAAKFIRRRRWAIAVYGLLASVCISALAAGASIWRTRELQKEAIRLEFIETQSAASRYPQEAVDRWTKFLGDHPNDHEAKVQLAYSHLRENDIAESIKVAEQLLTENPTNGPAHLLLALIYKRRNPELAQDHLRQGRQAVPDDRDYTYYTALGSSDAVEAVSILTDLLEKEGTNFDACWARAWRYFELGQYDKMLEDADYLIRSRQRSAPAWNTRGVALAGLDRFDEALDSFSHALKMAPNHASTYLNRADVYFNQGDYAAALEDCERAVAQEPDFAEAYARRALAEQKMGRSERVSSDCEHALDLQPRNTTARWVRARLLRQEGELVRAVSEINEALAIQPSNANLLRERGAILTDLQEYDAAFADYSTLCRQHDTAEARHGRGIAAARLGAFDVAMADFNRAIELDRKASYFGSRARLYRWMEDYSHALADNDQAIALAPDSLDANASRGISRWLAGDLLGAVEDFEKGLSIDAHRGAPSLLWLWQIHQARGDAESASAALTTAAGLISDPWQVRIIGVLQGSETAERLLELAVDDAKRCDAYYYLGAKAAVDGRNDDARRWFQDCVNLGYKPYSEYDLALGLLAASRG